MELLACKHAIITSLCCHLDFPFCLLKNYDNSVILPATVTVVIWSVWILWTGVFKSFWISRFYQRFDTGCFTWSIKEVTNSFFLFPSQGFHCMFPLTYHRILTHSQWQCRWPSHDQTSSGRKWLQPRESKIRDDEPGREYLKGHNFGKCRCCNTVLYFSIRQRYSIYH